MVDNIQPFQPFFNQYIYSKLKKIGLDPSKSHGCMTYKFNNLDEILKKYDNDLYELYNDCDDGDD